MSPSTTSRELAFTIHDVARLLRTLADHEARHFGITRAQWSVLKRLQRHEGLKQAELADMLDLQPITLTRLIDRRADNGLIERRADPDDRRAKRLFVTAAATPLLTQLDRLGEELMALVLDGISEDECARTLGQLSAMKDNLRRALAARDASPETTEPRKTSHG